MHYLELQALKDASDIGPLATAVSAVSKTLMLGIGYEVCEFIHIFQHGGNLHFLRYTPPNVDYEDDLYKVLHHTVSREIPVRKFMPSITSCMPEFCDFDFCNQLAGVGVRVKFEKFTELMPRPDIAAFTNIAELDQNSPDHVCYRCRCPTHQRHSAGNPPFKAFDTCIDFPVVWSTTVSS